MKIQKIGKYEYEIEDEYVRMMMMPHRHCNFKDFEYVYLFKPSKNPRLKTKVCLKRSSGCIHNRLPIECEDGKTRVVSVVGDFCVAGNFFNQRGESLGPNNIDYYVKKLDLEFDQSEYDIRFSVNDLNMAIEYNSNLD